VDQGSALPRGKDAVSIDENRHRYRGARRRPAGRMRREGLISRDPGGPSAVLKKTTRPEARKGMNSTLAWRASKRLSGHGRQVRWVQTPLCTDLAGELVSREPGAGNGEVGLVRRSQVVRELPHQSHHRRSMTTTVVQCRCPSSFLLPAMNQAHRPSRFTSSLQPHITMGCQNWDLHPNPFVTPSRPKRWRSEPMPITTSLLLTGRRCKAPVWFRPVRAGRGSDNGA
jgi:hypothetical protein